MAEVKRKAPANTFTVLVGNKVDSLEERCTTSDEAAYKAKEWGAMYAEVSAKTGENINNFFTKIARKLIEREFLTPQAEEVSDNVD
ncbi:unnamed protein product [Blepharisma stoltei]|uniref:Uncharacterized protein n=1 Tax=Blepharisma stoltei TaxID=1481888 RepID=A0AAU9JHU7_9CILI|nr:unnamed protein product [Blepharisma stoltei]